MQSNRPLKKSGPGLFTSILVVAGGIWLLTLLGPVLLIILAGAMVVGLVLLVAGWAWWLVKGRKIIQRAQEDMQQAVQQHRPAEQNRKWVQVKVQRADDDSADDA